jgi:hypothetical protein
VPFLVVLASEKKLATTTLGKGTTFSRAAKGCPTSCGFSR